MNMRRFLAICLSLCMIVSVFPFGAIAVENETIVTDLEVEKLEDVKVDLKREPIANDPLLDSERVDPNENVKVIIVMEAPSVIERNAAAIVSDETLELSRKLEKAQADVVAKIERNALEGKKLEISYNYTWLLNGVSATVPYGTIDEIKAIDGVKQVLLQPVYQVCEDVAQPATIADGVMIGRETTWAQGYTGEGMKIAIIDTGLDTDHQNFAALSGDLLTDTSATKASVAAVLPGLQAAGRWNGLTVDDVYYSSKVAFGFNYCDDNLNITHDFDGMGDHGTHVAGIAAANKVDGSDVVGVAPDAQLYVMKVFGANGGAYADDILAALEDALMLQADVVNMSLGSSAGFTSDSDEINAVYNRVAETNTVLSVSAGNNYSAGYANQWGTDQNLTTNPDNAIIGSPGTYANVLSVASVENWMIERNYIEVSDGYKITFTDTGASYELPTVLTLDGAYNVVAVPGYGAASDFEGLDLTGKIALVQRGVESFVTKVENAEAAGAIACLVYNNTSGEFGMDLTDNHASIPAASILMVDGEYLVSALASDPELTISFCDETAAFPSELAYQMSDFSSWGTAPDLSLEPDITAPGGNIYSTINDGQYGLMSGTSMAAPNVSGMSALVMQYVKENFDANTDYRVLVRDLLMSTSVPLTDENGQTYSPRKQGSGLANVFNAVATQAYLTVDGSDTAKVSLYDDPQRNGIYDYAFNVHNFGDTALYFALNTTAQTEGVVSYGEGLDFMSGTPMALSASTTTETDASILTHDVNDDGATTSNDAYWIYQAQAGAPLDENWTETAFRYDTTCDDTVAADDVQAYLDALVGNESVADLASETMMVGAGETAVVNVNVTLSDDDKTYLDTYFTNGGYVEGYTFLTAKQSGGIDLSLPYMGFYGSWTEAPVLDDGYYWDYYAADYDESMPVGSQYVNALFTEYGSEYGYPGVNAYVEETFDISHMAVSPNDDSYFDSINDIYLSLMRNAEELSVRYTDMATGEVYHEKSLMHVNKTAYNTGYGQIVPFVYSWDVDEMYDFTDANGETLANNTQVLLEIAVTGVYEGDETETWSVPITVDLEAPELLSAQLVIDETAGTKTLELSYRENHAVAVVALLSGNGSEIHMIDSVEDVAEDENGYQSYTVSYDVTDISGKVMLCIADYALNETYYGMNLNGVGTPYGDLVAFQYNYDTGINGWVSFDADVNADETTIFMSEAGFVAAEYVGGYVLAQTDDGKLYGFKYEDMLGDTMDLEDTYITTLENVYQDFAYSYAEGKLYGVYVYDDDGYPTTEVNSINLKGEYYDSNMWMNVAPYQEDYILGRGGLYGLSMAIDDAGTIYVLGHNYSRSWDENDDPVYTESETAHLWSVGLEYDEWTESYMPGYGLTEVGDVGLSMDYLQSMTWDHNAEKLYWARFDATGVFKLESQLVEIDPATAASTVVGTLSGETCALFAPLTAENAAKDEHSNIPDMDSSVVGTPILWNSAVTMNIGGKMTLGYDFDPWYTDHKELVWSSDNTDVVTVDANGTITAVGAGSATVTAANKADESKLDTVSVEVTALDLKFEGIVTAQTAGVGGTAGVSTYTFQMVDGAATFKTNAPITAPAELNYGLSLATSVMGRGSLWACEYGNTGMIYEIDPATGVVKDALQPIDGDMMFGMAYSEGRDTFTGIMNYYLYADLELTHEEEQKIINSYDEEQYAFMYHRVNMLSYLEQAGAGFMTGETGQGASSEVVFSGITVIEGGIKDSYGETYYNDTYKDFMGNWATGGMCSYQPDQTLVLLDNVGRLWYVNQISGVTMESDEWGNVFMYTPDGGSIDASRNGITYYEDVAEDGTVTCTVFHITQILETPLTDMFREGTMPRITYHFSDIAFAGYTADGDPMFAMSLYDYWNNGTTNELYLYIPGHDTGEMDYETWEPIVTPDRMFSLGNTGEFNIIATLHDVEVTGGVDAEAETETFTVNAIGVGAYTK